MMRVGRNGDGGYVIPDDLAGVETVVSPGVSTEVGFDLAMAARGMDVYLIDGSIDGPPVEHDRFLFTKKDLGVVEDERTIRLDTFCAEIVPPTHGDRILQMDVEGAEYKILLDAAAETLRSFRIMIIEFHFLDRLYASFSFEIIKATFEKLLRTHGVVHIHPNNVAPPVSRGNLCIPPIMEFTFLRNDRIKRGAGKPRFPHPLDVDNVPGKPTVVLPDCWTTTPDSCQP